MRLKKEWIITGALELLAILLAQCQSLGEVRTDEAKYLLNVPYPHPPLLRWVMSTTESLELQEMLWRVLFATLFIQAVWLVWDMGRRMPLEDRAALCAGWLLSAAVLTQAGTVMLAPVTAVQALVFLWLRSRPEVVRKLPFAVGLLWLASVFTAFQAVLFLPIVWSALRRSGQSRAVTSLYAFGPVVLLALWSLSNPLALATMVIHRDEGARGDLLIRLVGMGKLWFIGGSGIVSALGTWGVLRSHDRALQLSGLLVLAFVTLSIPFPSYAILWTPVFIGGLQHLFETKGHPHGVSLITLIAAGSAVTTALARPSLEHDAARAVMRAVAPSVGTGTILIQGSFGHQWQYESHAVIRRYKPEFAKDARAIICLNACEPIFNTSGWRRFGGLLVETWVRK